MGDKMRFELRFDADLYEALKKLADRSELSVNQLMQGVTRWAVANAHLGRPIPHSPHELETAKEPGIVWFGDDGEEDGVPVRPWSIAFVLDFTDGHALRSASDFYPREQP
jgi:hypothetical protein